MMRSLSKYCLKLLIRRQKTILHYQLTPFQNILIWLLVGKVDHFKKFVYNNYNMQNDDLLKFLLVFLKK